MFERFTDRARAVVMEAHKESREMWHQNIGCHHLLLGLLANPGDKLGKIFAATGVDASFVRDEIRRAVDAGRTPMTGHIPFDSAAKHSLELALRASQVMGLNYIGVEHLLIGIIDEGDRAPEPILACAILGDIIARDQPAGSAPAALEWLKFQVIQSFAMPDFLAQRFEVPST
jgi:ATP-dependent Clp protease ATP-binding subunit ClpC